MLSGLSFSKYCCGGNDFIIIDLRGQPWQDIPQKELAAVCNRKTGVGADGLIFILDDDRSLFRMKLFNADGSSAEVSYNGGRCLALFAHYNSSDKRDIVFSSDAGQIQASIDFNRVNLSVPAPEKFTLNLNFEEIPIENTAHFIRAGVPYLVIFINALEVDWMHEVATDLKVDPHFSRGTNVAFAKILDSGKIAARFFERGVEEETSSSGTGCVAVALLGTFVASVASPVTVLTQGGDFEICFRKTETGFENIKTNGKVIRVFEGRLS